MGTERQAEKKSKPRRFAFLVCPPPQAVEHIQHFLASPEHHKYQAVHGIPELLEAIRLKLAADNGIAPAEDTRIVVTGGGNMAFVNALLAVIPGGTFGIDHGCYLRVAYGALRQETVAEGIGRLVRGLRAIVD